MKREITVKVPVYKCVVDYVCGGCSTGCEEGALADSGYTAASPAKPAPAPVKPLPPLPNQRSTVLPMLPLR